MLAIRRLRRLHVTAAVTAKGQVAKAAVSKWCFQGNGGWRSGWRGYQGKRLTAWLTSKPVAVALVRKEAVRKLVRTESDGAGHAGAGCEP